MDVIAVYTVTAFSSIEILSIDYKTKQVIFRYSNGGKKTTRHRAKLRYTKDGQLYFRSYKIKRMLNDFKKV